MSTFGEVDSLYTVCRFESFSSAIIYFEGLLLWEKAETAGLVF
jgi:hypothetical protein